MDMISAEIKGYMANSSWIRRMFEAGIELKKKYGADSVCDFSLGNPDLPPPPEVQKALFGIAEKANEPFSLGYMPNAGFADVRAVVAGQASIEQGAEIPASSIVMSCGAAGGLNSLFRAILKDGDEVLSPAPYFVEYAFYAGNFGGKLVTVPSKEFTFDLDVPALLKAVTPKTRAVIINYPNNPTGQIYTPEQIKALSDGLAAAEKRFGTRICMIADEPYRFLNFEHAEIPSLLNYYDDSVVIGSYSKNLSLAGERIGYLAVNPKMKDCAEFVTALAMTTRILGFVNAPTLAQQMLRTCVSAQVDLDIYRRRRDAMAKVLDGAGLRYTMPRGAFYFFPKSPLESDTDFIDALVGERILAVPGRGFGYPGYFRLAFCVSEEIILRSADGFKRAVDKL